MISLIDKLFTLRPQLRTKGPEEFALINDLKNPARIYNWPKDVPAVTEAELKSVAEEQVAQAQAEIEAEEKAAAEKASALETLADWMRRNPAEAVKLMEATAKVTALETKVAAIEAAAVKR
jgi:hypothetical protein